MNKNQKEQFLKKYAEFEHFYTMNLKQYGSEYKQTKYYDTYLSGMLEALEAMGYKMDYLGDGKRAIKKM